MEFFLIVFFVIAVNIVSAVVKRARDSGGSSPSLDSETDSAADGFEDARRFVEEIKRRNAAQRDADAKPCGDSGGEFSDAEDVEGPEQSRDCGEDDFGGESEGEDSQPRQSGYPRGGFQNGDSRRDGYFGEFGGVFTAQRGMREEKHASEIAVLERQIAALNDRNSSLEGELSRIENALKARRASVANSPADLLRAPENLRAAFVVSEILSKPISLRKE